MDPKDSIEHFETTQAQAGAGADRLHDLELGRLVRTAAVVVAVLAMVLAVATFLSNNAVKNVITGETRAADASARLEANDVKTTVAKNDATLLRVIASRPGAAADAAGRAAALEHRIVTELGPIDARLERQIDDEHHARDHAEERHVLYELSAVGLQIAIVLASISIIARRRWLLTGGGALGLAAAGLLVAGLLS